MNFTIDNENKDAKVSLETTQKNGIYFIQVNMNLCKEESPKRLRISWDFPAIKCYSLFGPSLREMRNLQKNWQKQESASRFTSWMPIHTIISAEGKNRLCISVSDTLTPISIYSGVCEENSNIECSVEFFTKLCSPIKEYQATIRLDTRELPYYESIYDCVHWWEQECNCKPAYVPELARKPMYSTWYSFHQMLEKDKPCLAQHAAFIIQNNDNDAEWLKPYFGKMCQFEDYYINNCRHKTGLYFWLDDAAIGVDNDPSTFYRPHKSSASIYLNCFMYKELEAICYIGELLEVDISKYRDEADNLKEAVREHCYDEKDGMYYSVDLNLLPVDPNSEMHKGAPRHWDCLIQRIGCWSGFLAMWSGIATKEQAERMVKENLLDEKAYWAPYGVRTLSKYEKMYTIKKSGNPSCWLGPVWGISNYMVFRGLVKYGFEKEARELAEKTICLFENDITSSSEFHEYYDPEDGHPIMNPGFQNWNLLSLNMRAWLNNEKVVEEF